MDAKQRAAEKAVEMLDNGMIVGLGTGTTAYWAIHKIAERVHAGLNIKAVSSSKQSEELAVQLQIPMASFDDVQAIDVTIDGADEADPKLNLIKGGGGALLREKIIASNSKRFIIIVDESKMVEKLGKFPLPVEIAPFASNLTTAKLTRLGCDAPLRMNGDKLFISDNGHYIADCHFFGGIPDPEGLAQQISSIPGVMEHGLFIQMAEMVVVGSGDGVRIIERMVERQDD